MYLIHWKEVYLNEFKCALDNESEPIPSQTAAAKVARLKAELETAEYELKRAELGEKVEKYLNANIEKIRPIIDEIAPQFKGLISFDIFYDAEKKRWFPGQLPPHYAPNSTTIGHPSSAQIRKKRVRGMGSEKPPQEADYFVPILKILKDFGWAATVEQITPCVEKIIRPRLSEWDFQIIPSGVFIRWECRMRYSRKRMIENDPPLLNPDSPRGVWEATEAGKKFLQENLDLNE